MSTENELLELSAINSIRILSADAIQHANSGHPGMPMGAAAMAYTLWQKFLRHNPADPAWFDRDRFVLSAGHGSMLIYSLLHLTGYDLSLDDIKSFRQWGSKTPGHPERGHTPGVEVATGPLGQGFSNAVGMAMAEAWLAAKYNKPCHEVVNHHTYAICGDGCLMEGITQEAASLAGHLKLGKLIVLYDDNKITLAGGTNLSFTENVGMRFDAYGWQTIHVADGNDTAAIAAAIEEAKADTTRPSMILVRTHIGFGSPKKHDNFSSHGSPLGEDELVATKKALGWPTTDKFFIPADALAHFREALPKGAAAETAWAASLEAYKAAYPVEGAEFEMISDGGLPEGWDAELPKWKPSDKPIATRVAGGEALNALARRIPNILGGSADLNPSTNTALKGMGDFQPLPQPETPAQGAVGGPWGYIGRNLAFGVREHAMGAAVNGMAAHGGIIPFSATFFVFSDYMKPAVRLGALMGLKVVYVFTHDSIGVGEDGPTHEPIEHLAALRSIPKLNVIRPGDATETSAAWAFAVQHNGPTALILSRQNMPHLDLSKAVNPDVSKGAYILSDCAGTPDVLLIATGSEVALTVKAQEKLASLGVNARVVNMPSMNLFEAQDAAYRESVLPSSIRARVTVESASTFGWDRFAGFEGTKIGIDHYGASAPGDVIMTNFGFTVGNVAAAALRLVGKNAEADAVSGSTETAFTGPTLHHA